MRTRVGGQKGTSECLKALFSQEYLDDMTTDRTAPFRGDGRATSDDFNATDSIFRRSFITNFCQLQTTMTVRTVKSCIKSYLAKRKDHLSYLHLLQNLTRQGYAGRDHILTGVNALRLMLATLNMTPKQSGVQRAIIEAITNGTYPPQGVVLPRTLAARPNARTTPTRPARR